MYAQQRGTNKLPKKNPRSTRFHRFFCTQKHLDSQSNVFSDSLIYHHNFIHIYLTVDIFPSYLTSITHNLVKISKFVTDDDTV